MTTKRLKPSSESAPFSTVTDAPTADRSQILSDVADFLADALQGTDEAYTLASEKLGEADDITKACLEAWYYAETAFRLINPARSFPDSTSPNLRKQVTK